MKYNKLLNKLIINKYSILLATILITLLVIGGIYGVSKYVVKKGENPKMFLPFGDRDQKLKEFENSGNNGVGWLQVQGTNIDFPIVNASDSDYGDNHKYGWRSAYYVTGENREVIFGHNIINVSSEPLTNMEVLSAFEGLMAFVYEDFAKENLYIGYTKDEKMEIYKIYGVRFSDYDEELADSFSNKDQTKAYIKKVLKNSIYDYDVDVTEDDELLTLKTCTRYFGLNENQEFSIDARKVRESEIIDKYSVKKNKNHEILNKNSNV